METNRGAAGEQETFSATSPGQSKILPRRGREHCWQCPCPRSKMTDQLLRCLLWSLLKGPIPYPWNKIKAKGNKNSISVAHSRSQSQIGTVTIQGEPAHMWDLPLQSDSDGSACAGPGRQPQQWQLQDAAIHWRPPHRSRVTARQREC